MSTIVSVTSGQNAASLSRELFERYENFRSEQITSRRFTQATMLGWLRPLERDGLFVSTPVGRSAEGRTISQIKLGRGTTTVLLWSQMHGDESTATMALMDILHFFAKFPDHVVTKTILRALNVLMIPMLNPDGAERFQRRTAQSIDMNRDALALRTPEASILKERCIHERPQFGFNLHDQDPRYTVGATKRVSAVALLAPAFNEAREDNTVRESAKKVASTIAALLKEFVPGHISRYDDAFEPRAFGDNIQLWGTSTILIESGGWPGDREKQLIRKLNCVAILGALYSIATGEYNRHDVGIYEKLPVNTKNLYDVILRNAQLKGKGSAPAVMVDIGINIDEEVNPQSGQLELTAKVVDIGDLCTYGAFREIDVGGVPMSDTEIRVDQRISLGTIESFFGIRK